MRPSLPRLDRIAGGCARGPHRATRAGLPAAALLLMAAGAAAAEAPGSFGGLPSFPMQGRDKPAGGPVMLPSTMTAPSGVPGLTATKPPPPGADLAFGAFQRGYFATALTESMKRLKANPADGAAMALIAEIYAQGLAVRPDPAEAARWNKLASEAGNREATFAYAMALLTGKGVAKDRKAAERLFREAADRGHPGALYNLGVMAISGEDGAPRDFPAAAAWFRKAADAGDVDALFALSTLTGSGGGVPADLGQAATLMKAAADEGHIGAEVEYGIMLFNGKGVEKDEAEAARYFRKAALRGNPVAENRLARLYAAGRGVGKDGVEAARWHILARAAGIKDDWLDDQLAALPAADKARVEDALRRQLGP